METISDALDFVADYHLERVNTIPPNWKTKPKTSRKTEKVRVIKNPQEKQSKNEFNPFVLEKLESHVPDVKFSEQIGTWKPIQQSQTVQNKTIDDYLHLLSEPVYVNRPILPQDLNFTQPTNPEKYSPHGEESKPLCFDSLHHPIQMPKISRDRSNLVQLQEESKTQPDTASWLIKMKGKTKNRYIKKMIDYEEEQMDQPKVHEPQSFEYEYFLGMPPLSSFQSLL